MQKPILPEPIVKTVVKAFGLDDLSAGTHGSSEKARFLIESIWVIEFPFYFVSDIYIAGVNRIEWIPDENEDGLAHSHNVYKGLLLASPYTKFDFYGANPYDTIDMKWPDEIVKDLQSMNILPYFSYVPQADGDYKEYKVHTFWQGGEGHVSYNITSQRSEMQIFQRTILSTIKTMASIYNNVEINRIIELGRNPLR